MFVKPRTSPFTGGHSSHALRFGPLGGARRTQMRSSALGVLPQCPCGLILDCDRHTSHCESNFGSFCRGCPTQRSRVPSAFFRVVCRPRLVSLVVLFGGCVAFGALLGLFVLVASEVWVAARCVFLFSSCPFSLPFSGRPWGCLVTVRGYSRRFVGGSW